MVERWARPASSGSLWGVLAIALAAALWAAAASVARSLFDDGVEPLELVQARAYVTFLGLAVIPAAWRRPGRGASIAGVVALGAAIALVNVSYYVAIDHLDVAVAIVLQYTAPVGVVAWTAITTAKRPSGNVVLTLVGAILGVVLVSGILEGVEELSGLGIAMGLCAAIMFATYTILSERVGGAYGVLGALLRGFAVTSAAWVLYQLPRGFPSALIEDGHLGRVLFVGVGGTLAPFLLYLWGVQRVRAERAAIVATLEPVLAGLFAWLWLGQVLSLVQMIGGAIVIASVAWLQLRDRATRPSARPLNV
jgi:DME family drug/metabolite transporter